MRSTIDQAALGSVQPDGVRQVSARSYEERHLRLDVSAWIAVREVGLDGRRLYYLSLFDDEIDARLNELMASGGMPLQLEKTREQDGGLRLEPTDVAVVCLPDSEILVARGGAANFPLYWRSQNRSIHISTALPAGSGARLSSAGLMASVAAATVSLQHEPNFTLLTSLAGWFRFRRGFLTRLTPGSGVVSESPIDLTCLSIPADSREALIEAIRMALDDFGGKQKRRRKAIVELSGGFDSTLARVCLDGADLLPFALPPTWPALSEPSTRVLDWKRRLAVAGIASKEGVDRIYAGSGGDHLSSENLLQPVELTPLAQGAFSEAGWSACQHMLNSMRSMPALARRSTLAYFDDLRTDHALKAEFGIVTRSPFSDLRMAECGFAWTRMAAQGGARHGKEILADAFRSELPGAVRRRRGKVCWDGVCARAYAMHGRSIIGELERSMNLLDHIGLNVRWLIRRARELVSWRRTDFGSDDKEVIGAYALAIWLRRLGIENVTDCDWSESGL
jgi:hypothetical protein